MKLVKSFKWTYKGWGIHIYLNDWGWYWGYQDLFGCYNFYLPFATIILYTPMREGNADN